MTKCGHGFQDHENYLCHPHNSTTQSCVGSSVSSTLLISVLIVALFEALFTFPWFKIIPPLCRQNLPSFRAA